MITQDLQQEINKIYGMELGKQTGRVLIPAFLNDFRSVLDKADAGKEVTEEYMTEDKKMHLILKGSRIFEPSGIEKVVVSCIVNDVEVLSSPAKL